MSEVEVRQQVCTSKWQGEVNEEVSDCEGVKDQGCTSARQWRLPKQRRAAK